MTNTEIKAENGVLNIKIDLTKTFGFSKSGKTLVVASTDGFVPVAPGIILNLNVNKAK